MGEVYRARDTKLKRDVAIKVLPAEFARDAERLARAQREAEVLASLNHPNIAQIYGQEDASGTPCLVLEFVDGQTVEQRLKQGPLPVAEALDLARQIADALDAAHERGIVHRDLKPANVKITPAGQVKVLDFGLAKTIDTMPPEALSHSPTLAGSATGTGVILGTSGYMSPEQARGKTADARSDIWSFGVMLYEMLSGKPAFPGETVVEVLGGVLKSDADWRLLPSTIPPSVLSLLRHCLQKDRNRRLRSIADARFQIEQAIHEPASAPASAPPAQKSRERIWIGVALVAVIAAASVTVWHFASAPNAPLETRLQIVTPPAASMSSFAISPDGRKVVYEGLDNGKHLLWLRRLESPNAEALPGTDGPTQPFWSPDSRSVAFFADGKLKRIDIAGGTPQIVTDSPNGPNGAWNSDGTILFALTSTGPLQRVAASGGAAAPFTKVDPPRQVSHRFPSFLPDGRHFLFGVAGTPEGRGVYVASLDDNQPRRLFDADSAAVFAPPDQLLFVRQGTLFAQRFDLRKLETVQEPVAVATSVSFNTEWLLDKNFSVSQTGTLAYRSGKREKEFIWLDRSGTPVGAIGTRDDAQPQSIRLSPDGRTVAMLRSVNGNNDVWLMDAARGVLRRFTSDPADDNGAVWSPDSNVLVYTSRQKKGNLNLYRKPVNGNGGDELLVDSPENKFPLDWSADGHFLLYSTDSPKTGTDLWAFSFDQKKSIPVIQTNADEIVGRFSPDGRWVAFQSNETGRDEIYVQPFPGPGGKSSPISINGGFGPQWRSDGKEIYYIGTDNRLMAVPMTLRPNGQADAGTPVPLFSVRPGSEFEVSRDGKRFLVDTLTEGASATPITVILNWSGAKK